MPPAADRDDGGQYKDICSKRIIAKRKQDCDMLEESVVEQLLMKVLESDFIEGMTMEEYSKAVPPSDIKSGRKRFMWMFQKHFLAARNSKVKPERRRLSYDIYVALMKDLDAKLKEIVNPPPRPRLVNSTNATAATAAAHNSTTIHRPSQPSVSERRNDVVQQQQNEGSDHVEKESNPGNIGATASFPLHQRNGLHSDGEKSNTNSAQRRNSGTSNAPTPAAGKNTSSGLARNVHRRPSNGRIIIPSHLMKEAAFVKGKHSNFSHIDANRNGTSSSVRQQQQQTSSLGSSSSERRIDSMRPSTTMTNVNADKTSSAISVTAASESATDNTKNGSLTPPRMNGQSETSVSRGVNQAGGSLAGATKPSSTAAAAAPAAATSTRNTAPATETSHDPIRNQSTGVGRSLPPTPSIENPQMNSSNVSSGNSISANNGQQRALQVAALSTGSSGRATGNKNADRVLPARSSSASSSVPAAVMSSSAQTSLSQGHRIALNSLRQNDGNTRTELLNNNRNGNIIATTMTASSSSRQTSLDQLKNGRHNQQPQTRTHQQGSEPLSQQRQQQHRHPTAPVERPVLSSHGSSCSSIPHHSSALSASTSRSQHSRSFTQQSQHLPSTLSSRAQQHLFAAWNEEDLGEKVMYVPVRGNSVSCSVKKPSNNLNVKFEQNPPSIPVCNASLERFNTWDPFWQLISRVRILKTSTVKGGVAYDPKTKHQVEPSPDDSASARTALIAKINPKKDLVPEKDIFGIIASEKWGSGPPRTYETGDNALILRMLPIDASSKKRADCHLWPKGTFLRINGEAIKLEQRRQQSHDNSWKSMSKQLDLTPYVRDPQADISIEMCCYDLDQYIFAVSFCKYRKADALYKTVTTEGHAEAITMMSRTDGTKKVLKFCEKNTISLDSDDEEQAAKSGKIVFQLKCPLSKKLMETPVRGKECLHWQCFDLKTWLEVNEPVSGTRWRCGGCEKFVSIKDLELCGLTADLIEEFEDLATPDRDHIEYKSDGTYRLLPQAKSRYANKNNKRDAPAQQAAATNKRPRLQPVLQNDVIEIL